MSKRHLKFAFALLAVIVGLNLSPVSASTQGQVLTQQLVTQFTPNIEQTLAYKQYELRPKSELSKLIFLIDLYRGSDALVVFDGIENTSSVALSYARKYIGDNYRKEAADDWIQKHAYRAPKSGQVIYMKFADGSVAPLRDILLEQLKRIAQ